MDNGAAGGGWTRGLCLQAWAGREKVKEKVKKGCGMETNNKKRV